MVGTERKGGEEAPEVAEMFAGDGAGLESRGLRVDKVMIAWRKKTRLAGEGGMTVSGRCYQHLRRLCIPRHSNRTIHPHRFASINYCEPMEILIPAYVAMMPSFPRWRLTACFNALSGLPACRRQGDVMHRDGYTILPVTRDTHLRLSTSTSLVFCKLADLQVGGCVTH